jgi:hypothetical protein
MNDESGSTRQMPQKGVKGPGTPRESVQNAVIVVPGTWLQWFDMLAAFQVDCISGYHAKTALIQENG